MVQGIDPETIGRERDIKKEVNLIYPCREGVRGQSKIKQLFIVAGNYREIEDPHCCPCLLFNPK